MAKLNKKMKMKSKAAGGGGNTQAMQFNHALGQHILKNPLIIQALVEKVFYNIYLVSSDQSRTKSFTVPCFSHNGLIFKKYVKTHKMNCFSQP